ncbi:allantoinase AllB [Actinokineospora sp. NBRC 105648]|uniref:allantoinase AllB n=1 Tax=Actinokineospora sp. NBRC 105648 TaxID=3032206 RepID=UPI0024A0124F|nr:allantoinase AllB [Actinokineospora sp. NBRC 105648]GLZ43007.1 allantoinase [Actinokineospora sp. NBRC 105648]
MSDLVFRAQRVVTDREAPACVRVREGRIVALDPIDAPVGDARVVDLAPDEVLLPGLVDTHVHVNDPGRADWEGFPTATRAAAAGGVTTIVDMPLNSLPPTVDARALGIKRAAARGRTHVDVGFWGGAVPGNTGELAALHAGGVFGFKCFLLDSGVPEFGHLGQDELVGHLRVIAGLGTLLIAHAEDGAAITTTPPGRSYADFLASRPRVAENSAIELLVDAARLTGGRVHVVHLSSSDALPLLRAAKADGVRITVETCPHYLTFAAEDIPDGATAYKCCPPIREAANRELLWQGLADGVIDIVVSDHSPCTPELKRLDTGDFADAWGGVAGLQVGLSAVWTGARVRGVGLPQVVQWMAAGPADLLGLHQKGRIAPGFDADLVVFAPEEEFTVDAAALHHRNAVSAYDGARLRGVVRSTWLGGVEVSGDHPRGALLERA